MKLMKLDIQIRQTRKYEAISNSRPNLLERGSRVVLTGCLYSSIVYLVFGNNFAINQAHAGDNIATFGLPNQLNNASSLVITQSYQPVQNNDTEKNRVKTESIAESMSNQTPVLIETFTNNHYPDLQYAEEKGTKVTSGSEYKKTQPKVVMVNEPYASDNKQELGALVYKSNNVERFDNTDTKLTIDGSFANVNDTINSTTTITVDNTPYDAENFSISNQKPSFYSPLNAISPDTLKTFVKVIDLTRNEYVRPVSDEELFESAMKGMLKNLDSHAEFLNAQSYENLQDFTQGEVAQVGILANYDKKVANWRVTDISQGSPADQKGIEKGFFLHQIDGIKLKKSTSSHDVSQLLSGMAGTMVDVVVSDAGRRKNTLTLQRTEATKIAVSIVFDRGIAVIKIPVFQNNTRQQILDALVYLGKPINGVVLDLQDNPGGVVDSAIEVAGLFQKNMPVIQTKNRQGKQELHTAKFGSHLEDVPLVILQNRYSASAAEILASAIQSNKRGSVIGEVSYGKGTVQSVIPIDDEQAVKLTVAYYLSIDGKQINGVGVRPDITLISGITGNTDPDDTSISSLMNNKQEQHAKATSTSQPNTDILLDFDVHKKWQQQAVDILLEQNNYNAHILEDTRLTQLAKLNQQNRQLRKSLELSSNNGSDKDVVEKNMSEVQEIQQELQKALATPNGVLLVYPPEATKD